MTTNNGHHNGHYQPGDQWAQPAGANGQARQYAQPQPNQGQQHAAYGQQPYGYAQQIQGQPQGYAPHGHPQGYAGQQAYGQYGQPVYAPGAYVAPLTSQPVQVKQKRGKKAIVIAIIVAIMCIAIAVAIFLLTQQGGSSRAGTRGQLEGKTDAEIQAELNRQVEDGMFNISIASVVEFADGTSEGELRIENVPGNNYLMRVNINRDDTGETIYTSDLIEPDYHIQRDTLDVDLDQGTYPCTAVFTAYDPQTESEIGQAAAKITLQVKS